MRLSQNLILIPVLVQVLLTYAVMVKMGAARMRSAKAMGKSAQDLALATNGDWDRDAQKAANNFRNQFELPVLFYACCALALITRQVDPMLFVLASLFVLARIGHAWVHITSNIVAWRGSLYLVGAGSLLLMWLLLGWRVAMAGW